MVIAILAVTLATRLIVPLVLHVLALFIAPRALNDAAARVQRAGKAAVASIASGQRALLRDESHSNAARSTQEQEAGEREGRVADRAETRLRVDEPATDADPDAETFEPDSTTAKR
jgi:competence protein ComGC